MIDVQKALLLVALPLCFLYNPASVKAACVDADANVQLAITDGKTTPQQRNVVNSEISDRCFNNSAATSNTQVFIGNGELVQNRERSTYMGTPDNSLPVKTPNISNAVGVQMNLPLLDLIPKGF